MKSGVYMIFNTTTDTFYIGSTMSRGFINRRNEHLRNLRSNKHCNVKLQNYFNKYGENSFLFIKIEECLTREQCLSREQFYLDSLRPKLNIAKSATSPMFGRTFSKESLKKLMGRKSWNKGVPQTSEAKIKNVVSNGGSLVRCVDDGRVFIGVGEAAKYYKLNRQNLSSVLHGRLKTTGGLRFERAV